MKRRALGAFIALGLGIGSLASAADFNGDGTGDIAVYRPSLGLWSVRNVTRAYFGGGNDVPVPIDLDGDRKDEIAVFKAGEGLWAFRNLTRVYFGATGDIALADGGYKPNAVAFDYVVKPGDGADLVRALESDAYRSVFVPNGTYSVSEVINVDHVRLIGGEDMYGTALSLAAGAYLSIEVNHCHVERIRLSGGGSASPSAGAFYIDADYVTLRECRSDSSATQGFEYSMDAGYASLIDCIADGADGGFRGHDSNSSRLVNCAARNCSTYGFVRCRNLSNCWVDGYSSTDYGFYACHRISSSMIFGCTNTGFYDCYRISACEVNGNSVTGWGFYSCSNVSACHVEGTTSDAYNSCTLVDAGSCD